MWIYYGVVVALDSQALFAHVITTWNNIYDLVIQQSEALSVADQYSINDKLFDAYNILQFRFFCTN